jgi:hypothetical protein
MEDLTNSFEVSPNNPSSVSAVGVSLDVLAGDFGIGVDYGLEVDSAS